MKDHFHIKVITIVYMMVSSKFEALVFCEWVVHAILSFPFLFFDSEPSYIISSLMVLVTVYSFTIWIVVCVCFDLF